MYLWKGPSLPVQQGGANDFALFALRIVIDHLNPRFLNSKRKIDKETSVIFCAVGTEFSSFIHLL
jgi:hypothetical protein